MINNMDTLDHYVEMLIFQKLDIKSQIRFTQTCKKYLHLKNNIYTLIATKKWKIVI